MNVGTVGIQLNQTRRNKCVTRRWSKQRAALVEELCVRVRTGTYAVDSMALAACMLREKVCIV